MKRCGAAILFVLTSHHFAASQTKTYLTFGIQNYLYSTTSESLNTGQNSKYMVGVETDYYLSYHYAVSTGAIWWQSGYDLGVSRWNNTFIQVPLGIKAASMGDMMGIGVGFNFNYLIKSTLHEVADTLNNYVTTNVTKAFHRIQPDFYFSVIIRLKRVSITMKPTFALGNRYSTEVKAITDKNPVYYGSYYAYVLAKDDQRIKASGIQMLLAIRLF